MTKNNFIHDANYRSWFLLLGCNDTILQTTAVSTCPTVTTGGNANSALCRFPFITQGVTFYECTTQFSSSNRPWCATTYNYDQDQSWGYCAGIYCCVWHTFFAHSLHICYVYFNHLTAMSFWTVTTNLCYLDLCFTYYRMQVKHTKFMTPDHYFLKVFWIHTTICHNCILFLK